MKQTSHIFVIIVVLSGIAGLARQVPSPGVASNNGVIEGTVTNAVGQPLPKARIFITRTDVPQVFPEAPPLLTNDSGRFIAAGLAGGRYRIEIEREGYVLQRTGLPLAGGQRVRHDVRLAAAGVISGRVLNENGEPVWRKLVQAYTVRYPDATGKLVFAGSSTTNDLGEYRIFGLGEGAYIVGMIPIVTSGLSRDGVTITQTDNPSYQILFPDTIEPESASFVILSGRESRGIDFKFKPLKTVRVRGKVSIPFAIGAALSPSPRVPADLYAVTQISPVPPPTDVVRAYLGRTHGPRFVPAASYGTMVDKDGFFDISGVLPGSYRLTLIAKRTNGEIYSAQAVVTVAERDIDGLTFTLHRATNISGKIAFPAGVPQSSSQALRVRLVTMDKLGVWGSAAVVHEDFTVTMEEIAEVTAQPAEDGTFTLKEVPAGEYMLRAAGLPPGSYVDSATLGTTSVADTSFFIENDDARRLQINVAISKSRVSGLVRAPGVNGATMAATTVTLVPDEGRRSRHDLYFSTTSDRDGRYNFENVPPGDYQIFGWEKMYSGLAEDPAFISRFANRGQSVTVKPGVAATVDIQAIPAGMITAP